MKLMKVSEAARELGVDTSIVYRGIVSGIVKWEWESSDQRDIKIKKICSSEVRRLLKAYNEIGDDFLSVRQVADKLGVGVFTIYDGIKLGRVEWYWKINPITNSKVRVIPIKEADRLACEYKKYKRILKVYD